MADPIWRRVLPLAFGVADRRRLGRAQWLDLLVGVASAQFGIRGDRQATGTCGGLFPPVLPVAHGLGKDPLSLPIARAQGLVGGSQLLLPPGAAVVAGLPSGIGFGGRADGVQLGVGGAEPAQSHFLSDVRGAQAVSAA